MARKTAVDLSEHFSAFVDEQLATGRYGSVGEVVQAGLALLEDQAVQQSVLRAALIEGEQSGLPANLDVEEFLAAKRQAWHQSHPSD